MAPGTDLRGNAELSDYRADFAKHVALVHAQALWPCGRRFRALGCDRQQARRDQPQAVPVGRFNAAASDGRHDAAITAGLAAGRVSAALVSVQLGGSHAVPPQPADLQRCHRVPQRHQQVVVVAAGCAYARSERNATGVDQEKMLATMTATVGEVSA